MNERSGFNRKYLDHFSIVADAYDLIFMKENI